MFKCSSEPYRCSATYLNYVDALVKYSRSVRLLLKSFPLSLSVDPEACVALYYRVHVWKEAHTILLVARSKRVKKKGS
jgi:hypothetical protein